MRDRGAHFYRVDLQVHSPRDPQWDGARAVTDDERKALAQRMVAHCRSSNLQAIAITDHHDLAFFPFIKAAASEELGSDGAPLRPEERLVVFPGLELTFQLPCQALLIFDADIPLEHLDPLPGALGYEAAPAADAATPQTTSLHLNHPDEVYERLEQRPTLKGRFIVLPNVTEKGHQTILRKGFNHQYKKMIPVGGYVDKKLPKVGTGQHKIVCGEDANYGNKPLAVFQTSDARSLDLRELGPYGTWVKWSRPTAEALRQSCLARTTRVRQEAPQMPAVWVSRVEVSASKFLGRLDLFMNREFTALIGGRGTGKSTLIEYLRWALCNQPISAQPDGELPDYQKRHLSLIEKTLAPVSGEVRVEAEVNGVPYVVVRKSTPPEIRIKVGTGEFRSVSEDELRRLLPLEAFSQKQLSAIGATDADLLSFVTNMVSREVQSAEQVVDEAARRLAVAIAERHALQGLRREHEKLVAERDALAQQLTAAQQALVGVNPDDAKLLGMVNLLSAQTAQHDEWKLEIEAARTALTTATKALTPSPVVDVSNFPQKEQFEVMQTALRAAIERAHGLVAAAAGELAEAKLSAFTAAAADFAKKRAEAQVAYTAARDRMKQHDAALKQIDELRKKVDALDAGIRQRTPATAKLTGVELEVGASDLAWRDAIRARAAVLEAACATVTSASGDQVRASLKLAGDLASVKQAFTMTIKGSGVRSERADDLFQRVSETTDVLDAWTTVLTELESLVGLGSDAAVPHCPTLRTCGFNERDLKGIGAKLDMAAWTNLRTQRLRDQIEFGYRARDGDYIRFEDASAGQRATALLRVLLAQSGPPLVIDQPEEDLDNSTIHEIAAKLGEAKQRRQLIFASHNANIVVNGDADLVAVFDYQVAGEQTAGRIACEGAIDDSDCRDRITSVMEGGRDAFTLRRNKYGY